MENKEMKKPNPKELTDEVLNNVSGGTETETRCVLCGRKLTNEDVSSVCVGCEKRSLDELMTIMEMRVWQAEKERRDALQAVKGE